MSDGLLVSIIVPVYNVENYLAQCVNSLLQQTYRNLEIILVDDGSSDKSPQICDEFSNIDSRVKVIHKTNGGVNSARKEAIEHITGQYVMFVDSDDWIALETIEECMDKALKLQADCIMFSYVREYAEKSIENQVFPEEFCYRGHEVKDKIHRRLIGPIKEELSTPQKVDSVSPICMKLYKTEFVKKGKLISERIIGTSEDTVFNIYALEDCGTVGYLNRSFYHYRKTNEESLTTRYKNDLVSKWDILYEIIRDYVKKNAFPEEYTEAFHNRVACGMIGLGLNEINSSGSFRDKRKRIGEIITKPLYKKSFKQLEIKWCPLPWKVFFTLCKIQNSYGVTALLCVMKYLRSRMSN